MTRVLPRFPARVRGINALSAELVSGVLEIGIDPTNLAKSADPTAAGNLTFILNTTTDEFELAEVASTVVDIATQAEAEAGSDNQAILSALRGKQSILVNAPSATVTQPAADAVARPMLNKSRDVWTVFDFIDPAQHTNIVLGTYTSDLTTQLQKAANSGERIEMRPGRYVVEDIVTLGNGQVWEGSGRSKSIISIPSSFNLAALGVVRLGTGEPGATIRDIGFEFDQPDVTARASMVQYPPAIYAVDAARFTMDNIRISGGWDGIDATGNCGGSYIGRLEVGAINTALDIDGSLDFFHIGALHSWRFGFTSTNRGAAYAAAALAGQLTAASFGRCDGLAVSLLSTFEGAVRFPASGSASSGRDIAILQLDGDGARLLYDGGPATIGQSYWTKSSTPVVPTVLVTDGRLRMGVIDQRTSAAASDIKVTGGELYIGGGFSNQNDLGQSAFEVTGGLLDIDGISAAFPGGNRTAPYYKQSGAAGVLRLSGTDVPTKSTYTGSIVSVGVDHVDNSVRDNDFDKWDFTIPSAPWLGEYGPNIENQRGFTSTLSAGAGTFTSAFATGVYQIRGNWIIGRITIVITTNGTAAGTIVATLPAECGTGLAFAVGQIASSGVAVTGLVGGTTVTIRKTDATYPGADGATIGITFEYEMA